MYTIYPNTSIRQGHLYFLLLTYNVILIRLLSLYECVCFNYFIRK
nr:hypothetical protein CJLB15_00024 [Campylobacter phage CJLB-15]